MMLLLAAAALPMLFWDAPPSSAPALREAGIASIRVPEARLNKWRSVTGVSVEAAGLDGLVKLIPPGVQYRPNTATASREPWIDSNGWQFLRNPQGRFYYDVPGAAAALAAAEAFCFGGEALIHTDAAGLGPFGAMVQFLRGLGGSGPGVADILVRGDGSDAAAEVMNLLVRNNLLFSAAPLPGDSFQLTVGPPFDPAQDPSLAVHDIRARLTDDKRSLRIYGSSVVIGRLTALPGGIRVHLLNYAATERSVNGIRVRVAGRYRKPAQPELFDFTVEQYATEFTLPKLDSYTVVDLTRQTP